MAADIRIDQATLSDLDAILVIEHACFDLDSFSKRQFVYLITKAKGVFYVVRFGGNVVAYASLVSNARTRNLRIYSIAVHPKFRGLKLAQLLMDQTFEYARSNRLKAITLEVKTTNIPAISLYEKYGFVKHCIRYNYYQDGSNAYGMRLVESLK